MGVRHALAAICILERDATNHIEKIGFPEALGALAQQAYRPEEPEALMKALSLVGRLSGVNLYRLGCNMEKEAAWVSYRGMEA